nr:hypothetical protein [Tanacetum cinerariifolium]
MAAVEVPHTLEYMGGQLNATPVLEDFQDSLDDEEDTRSSHEYLNELEGEYQARALGHFERDCWSKTSVPSYQSPFQSKLLLSSKNKPESRQIKDFEAKYHKFKAKLALLSSNALTPSSSSGKNKGLIAKMYDWDDKEVSTDENEVTEVKALMALPDEERVSVGKESARNGDWTKISMKKELTTKDTFSFESKETIFIKSLADNSDMPVTNSNIHKSYETEDSTLPNQDSDEKLDGAEHVSGPKTIKSVLKSKSTFKAETLKGITINEPSSAPARGKSSLAFKTNSAPASKLKNMKIEDDPPLAIVMIISLRRGINPKNPQHVTKNYETYGSNVHTTSAHNDIKWFRKRETLEAKNDESFKASKNESSSALRSKTLTKRWVSRQN